MTAARPDGLKPASVLGASRDHGDRLRYVGGCRCDLCRKANSAYECARKKAREAGDWNGMVDAEKARKHLLMMSRKGVGKRAVHDATDVALSVLLDIRTGRKLRIRARTERLILGVTTACRSDAAKIPAERTHALIADLLEEGYTRKRICQERGVKLPAIQLGKRRVLVKTAAQIERIHQRLTA